MEKQCLSSSHQRLHLNCPTIPWFSLLAACGALLCQLNAVSPDSFCLLVLLSVIGAADLDLCTYLQLSVQLSPLGRRG